MKSLTVVLMAVSLWVFLTAVAVLWISANLVRSVVDILQIV